MKVLPETNIPTSSFKSLDKQRISQWERLLTATTPKGEEGFWNQRRQLISKEQSLANLDRSDMYANHIIVEAILEFLKYGQRGLCGDTITKYVNDLKTTMSIEGKFVDHLLENKIEYVQTQSVHEYQHPARKPGLFPSKNVGGP